MMLAEKAAAHYATKVDKLQAPVTNYTHTDRHTHTQLLMTAKMLVQKKGGSGSGSATGLIVTPTLNCLFI